MRFILLAVLVTFLYSVSCDIPDDVAGSLISLLAEEKTLRAHLEDDVTALEQELADVKTLRQDASCGCPLSMAPIAFSAVLTTNLASFGVGQIIVFDKSCHGGQFTFSRVSWFSQTSTTHKILFKQLAAFPHILIPYVLKASEVDVNIGSGYDVRHGTFVAPVDGIYDFSAASLIQAGYHLGIEMVHNTDVVAKTHSGDNGYYTMGTMVVALRLKKGDEVFVRHGTVSDSNRLNGESHTSFTGYLIEESI